MADSIQESTVWPVNELGEIVFGAGTGTTNVVGFINSSVTPKTSDNKVVAVGFKPDYGSNIAVIGDSIFQQSTFVGSGSYNYMQRGSVCWMLSYLGFPWEFQPSDNFAVFGTTMDAVISTQLPQLEAANKTRKYSRCFISSGTNDAGALTATDTIKSYYTTIFDKLRTLGMIPVHTGIRPRGTDVSLTSSKKIALNLNEWLYEQSLLGKLEFIDTTAVLADNSTAFGNALTTLTYDSGTSNLHYNGRGASLEGLLMANYYIGKGVVPQLRFATNQADIFDRTYNPSGIAFNNPNPLLQGGTTAPTGMTTAGGTWSKVSRTLVNGQTRSDPQCALAASTLHYLYDDWLGAASGGWTGNQPAPGDIFEARAKVVVASGVNIQNIQLRASTSDGTSTTSHYGLFTDTSSVPDGSYTLYLKTPQFTIPPYSGSGQVSVYCRMECQTSAGASGTFTVQAFELRKVG